MKKISFLKFAFLILSLGSQAFAFDSNKTNELFRQAAVGTLVSVGGSGECIKDKDCLEGYISDFRVRLAKIDSAGLVSYPILDRKDYWEIRSRLTEICAELVAFGHDGIKSSCSTRMGSATKAFLHK